MSESYSLHQFEGTFPEQKLLEVIANTLSKLSKREIRHAIMAGLCSVNGEKVDDVHYSCGDENISIELDLRHGSKSALSKQIEQRPFQILHLDKEMVIVDKASGVLASQPKTEPDEGFAPKHLADLVRRTLKKMGKNAPYVGYVHRLDLDTSGCICLALTKDAHRKLAKQFQEKTAQRIYRCIVTGSPKQERDTLKGVIARGFDGRRRMFYGKEQDGESAVTHFKVMERFEGGADLEVSLETGRTHQVRLAMASIASPIFGDHLYGDKKKIAPRLMLHAWKIEITHPSSGELMSFEAPMPKMFAECRPPRPGKVTRRKNHYGPSSSSGPKPEPEPSFRNRKKHEHPKGETKKGQRQGNQEQAFEEKPKKKRRKNTKPPSFFNQ